MARPEVGVTTEDLYAALGPLSAGDEARGWPLLLFCDAFCGSMFEQISTYVRDRDDAPGWAIALDPDNAPLEALPFAAQFAGVELPPGLTEVEQRLAIKQHAGFARGTPAAIIAAAQRTLTGGKNVLLDERHTGAYQLRIRTYDTETPDPAATEAAIRTQKPIGLILDYEAVDGQTWGDLASSSSTWSDVSGTYDTWRDVALTLP